MVFPNTFKTSAQLTVHKHSHMSPPKIEFMRKNTSFHNLLLARVWTLPAWLISNTIPITIFSMYCNLACIVIGIEQYMMYCDWDWDPVLEL